MLLYKRWTAGPPDFAAGHRHPDEHLTESPMITKSLYAVAVAASLMLPAACSSQSNATQPAPKDIVQTAVDAGTFNTLVAAVKAAGLVETLQGQGPFTVFAPTDAAFAKLPAGTVESLLANPQKLAAILTFHVVPGKVLAADIVKANGAKPKTVNGQSLDVVVRDGKVLVNGGNVIQADVAASNGVIHVIDTVLIPAAPATVGQ
jgi:transforming growth factor-beta-induced protein